MLNKIFRIVVLSCRFDVLVDLVFENKNEGNFKIGIVKM